MDEEFTGESSDDEVGWIARRWRRSHPSLARGTQSRPTAPPRSDPSAAATSRAAEPEPEPGPASWPVRRAISPASSTRPIRLSWRPCPPRGRAPMAESPPKMACSADNPDCECHRRDWDREVLRVSPTGCVLAPHCSPRGAGKSHGMSKATVRCGRLREQDKECLPLRERLRGGAAALRGQRDHGSDDCGGPSAWTSARGCGAPAAHREPRARERVPALDARAGRAEAPRA